MVRTTVILNQMHACIHALTHIHAVIYTHTYKRTCMHEPYLVIMSSSSVKFLWMLNAIMWLG